MFSCSKEEFIPDSAKDSLSIGGREEISTSFCSNATQVKPRVDVVIVWDNSSSTNFLNQNTRYALQRLLSSVARKFDYRIILGRMVEPNTQNNWKVYVVAENPVGMAPFAITKLRGAGDMAAVFADLGTPVTNSTNWGFKRVKELLQWGINHSVLRSHSYVFPIIVSDEDDNEYQVQGISQSNLVNNYFNDYLQIKNALFSTDFHFLSVVPQQSCGIMRPGFAYINMSNRFSSQNNVDTFNLCTADFLKLFDGPNQTIQNDIINHVYNFFPLAQSSGAQNTLNIDASTIRVVKNTGIVLTPNSPNGFSYNFAQNPKLNSPTRILPSVGEILSGHWHVIELHGQGRLTYPECLRVTFNTPFEYYGWFALSKDPDVSTIRVTRNGFVVPQSSQNGWQFIPGFQSNRNIKISSPTLPNTEGFPAILKSGYFLKLNGSAILSNGDTIEVTYTPSSNN